MGRPLIAVAALAAAGILAPVARPGEREACVVISHDSPAVREALVAFREAFEGTITEVLLDGQTPDALSAAIVPGRFGVHVALGTEALDAIAKLPASRPVLYGMVVSPDDVVDDRGNVGGVPMMPAPRHELEMLKDLAPGVRRVLTIYSTAASKARVAEGREQAKELDLELVALEAANPEEAARLLRDNKGTFDAFWMLPDRGVLSPDLVQYLLLLSFERKAPVVAVARSLVEKGFLFSLSPVAKEVGSLLGGLARDVADGSSPRLLLPQDPELAVNLRTARTLGLSIPPTVREKAAVTY